MGALGRVAEQLGINKETLRGRVNQAKVDTGDKPGTTTSDSERLAQLEKGIGSCDARMRFCGQHRLSSRRSSTAPVSGNRPHHRAQRYLRRRADLPDFERSRHQDRVEYLLRRIANTPSDREIRDRILVDYLQRLFTQNFHVYGHANCMSSSTKTITWPLMVKGLWLAAPSSD